MPFLILLICVALFSGPALPQTALKKNVHILLITPRNDAFWTLFADIAQATGQDLGAQITWKPAMNDAQKQLKDAMLALQSPDKPDAIIMKNFDGTAVPIVQAAEKAGVYTLLIEEGFHPEEARTVGRPREKYSYWLGEFLPDNFESGYQMAKLLIHKAQKRFHSPRLEMLAIAGNMNEGSSLNRVKGLFAALSEHPEVILHEISAAYWKEEDGQIKAKRLLQAYPNTHMIWTNNATMPLGAFKAVQELTKSGQIKHRPLIGSQGTTPPAAMDVWQKRVDASTGSQFLAAAFSVVLLYDYLQGYDFASESTLMRLQVYNFDQANVENYARAFANPGQNQQWQHIDFRRFSKAWNPGLQKYPFGFQPILDQFKSQP